MTHLLGTNICSAHMRRPGGLAHRFFQHAGGLAIATVILAELFAGAYKRPNPNRLLSLIADLVQEVAILDFDEVLLVDRTRDHSKLSLFYPDLESRCAIRAKLTVTLREFLVENTGDPLWPASRGVIEQERSRNSKGSNSGASVSSVA